jgi:hypothetical protein
VSTEIQKDRELERELNENFKGTYSDFKILVGKKPSEKLVLYTCDKHQLRLSKPQNYYNFRRQKSTACRKCISEKATERNRAKRSDANFENLERELNKEFKGIFSDFKLSIDTSTGRTKVLYTCDKHELRLTKPQEYSNFATKNSNACSLCISERTAERNRDKRSYAEIIKDLEDLKRGKNYILYSKVEKSGRECRYLDYDCVFHPDASRVICQAYNSHVDLGSGCEVCWSEKLVKTREERGSYKGNSVHLEDIEKIFGDRFSKIKIYSEGYRKFVSYFCNKHESLISRQYLSTFKSGSVACEQCINEENSARQRQDPEQSIQDLIEIKGNKYVYLEVFYSERKGQLGEKGYSERMVRYECPHHGEQTQRFEDHKRYDCQHCGRERTKEALTLEDQVMIDKVHKIHVLEKNKSYSSYSIERPEGRKPRVTYYCGDCSEWVSDQEYNSHLRGTGCPGCANYGYNRLKPGFFYYWKTDRFIKFGITNVSPLDRMKRSRICDAEMIFSEKFDDGNIPLEIETALKRTMRDEYPEFQQYAINTLGLEFPGCYETIPLSFEDVLLTHIKLSIEV